MKRNFYLKLLESIIFIAICTILFTIIQNIDLLSNENFDYRNLIFIYLGWWVGETIIYLYNKYQN